VIKIEEERLPDLDAHSTPSRKGTVLRLRRPLAGSTKARQWRTRST